MTLETGREGLHVGGIAGCVGQGLNGDQAKVLLSRLPGETVQAFFKLGLISNFHLLIHTWKLYIYIEHSGVCVCVCQL